MKGKYSYFDGKKQTEREYSYIPFRYILAVFIALLEVLAVIDIVTALCYYVPYFYLAAWATEFFCVIRIIASDDNPDYKVSWGCMMTLPGDYHKTLKSYGIEESDSFKVT